MKLRIEHQQLGSGICEIVFFTIPRKRVIRNTPGQTVLSSP